MPQDYSCERSRTRIHQDPLVEKSMDADALKALEGLHALDPLGDPLEVAEALQRAT